jgi:nitroreductase
MNAGQDFLSLVRGRRSIRRFKPHPVPPETVRQLVETACWAPSAGNRQDWSFCAVTSPSVKRDMAEAVRRRWKEIIAANSGSSLIDGIAAYSAGFGDFEHAPVVVVVSVRRVNAFQKHMLGDDAAVAAGGLASAAMAAQTMMLAAHALGLGSCCMTGALAARAELARMVGVNRRHEIICLVALGWPDEMPDAPARAPVDDVLRFVE